VAAASEGCLMNTWRWLKDVAPEQMLLLSGIVTFLLTVILLRSL